MKLIWSLDEQVKPFINSLTKFSTATEFFLMLNFLKRSSEGVIIVSMKDVIAAIPCVTHIEFCAFLDGVCFSR